jgi:carbonic anhydrase
MRTIDAGRRRFLRTAGSSLIAVGAVSSLGLSARPALGDHHEAVTQTKASQAAITPAKALQMLKDGNGRYVQGKMLQRDYIQQAMATAVGQYPFAAVVGCIDSRESAQLTFDQGIGDIFSARVAGNFVNDDILGSLEFAAAVTGVKLVLVVGHSECGAIKGACDDVVLGNLTQTLANIKPAVAAVSGFDSDRTSANPGFVQAVAVKNVELTVARIRQRSPVLRDLADQGQIGIAGSMYDVHTGQVTFM